MDEVRYPDSEMEFAQPIPLRWQQFADLREELLLDYSYNTARAYWADLQDVFEWSVRRDKNILTLTEKDIRQYAALHRRRKYSESSIRRRITAMRLLYGAAKKAGIRTDNPAELIVIR